MIIINKSIMHTMDFNSGINVLSEQELNIKNDSVNTFLTKHIEKIVKDPNSQTGNFYPASELKKRIEAYRSGSYSFIDFSIFVAKAMYSAISQSDILDPADLLICDAMIDEQRLMIILKCNNKLGFTHHVVMDNGKMRNDIINHYAILPNISQKIDEYALIEMDTLNIKFSDKKRCIDGRESYVIPEIILQCSSTISAKGAIDLVKSIAKKVSESHGQISASAVSKAKNYIVENAEISDFLNTVELGREVFSSSQVMQDEYIKEVKEVGLPEKIKVDKDYAVKKSKNHKIKTDTGIEIIFPVDYFQNKDFIEIVNNPDGTLSIELKNIGKLIDK